MTIPSRRSFLCGLFLVLSSLSSVQVSLAQETNSPPGTPAQAVAQAEAQTQAQDEGQGEGEAGAQGGGAAQQQEQKDQVMTTTTPTNTISSTLLNVFHNISQKFNTTYTAGQVYTLYFTLDGPSGSGLFQRSSQIQEFTGYMQNITLTFPPELASFEDVAKVNTLCTYLTQRSFDDDLLVTATAQKAALLRRKRDKSIFASTRQAGVDPLWEAILRANTTYQYTYLMNYSSSTVNVSKYPNFYEQKMRNSKAAFTIKLRQILNVSANQVLKIQDIFAGPVDDHDGTSILFQIPFPEEQGTITLNFTSGNETEIFNISQLQTIAPTVATATPSSYPTGSAAPTISSSPTKVPTTRPSISPTNQPSVSPSMYPSYFTNTSSRGRYELTFIVTGPKNPRTMFLNNTLFCEVMQSYTPLIAPEEDNPDLVYTTCPTIDGAFTPTPPAVSSLAPVVSPIIDDSGGDTQPSPQYEMQPSGPQDEDGDGDLDIPIPPAFAPTANPTSPQQASPTMVPTNNPEPSVGPTELALVEDEEEEEEDDVTTGLNVSFGRTLSYLRGGGGGYSWDDGTTEDSWDDRDLQEIVNGTQGTPIEPPPYPSYTWRYTIILRYTSAYFNVSEYPNYMEAYINNNKTVLEDQLIETFNLTNSNTTLEVISFVLFEDVTRAPTERPSSSPSEQPSTVTTLEPTEFPSESPSRPTNSSRPPALTGVPGVPSTLPPISAAPTSRPTPRPTSKPGREPEEKVVIVSVTIVVVFLASLLMIALLLLYRKRHRAKMNAYKSTNRRPSEGPEEALEMPPTRAYAAGGGGGGGQNRNYDVNDAHMHVSTAATISPSQLSIDLSSASQPLHSEEGRISQTSSTYSPKQPQHSKELSNGSASLASTVSDAVSSQGSSHSVGAGGAGAGAATATAATTTTNPEQQKKIQPPRSLLSDIEEDPDSVDDLVDDDDDDVDVDRHNHNNKNLKQSMLGSSSAMTAGGTPLDPFAQYNDRNLEKMRCNVEDNVTGLDGMMSQAMTRALISASSKETLPAWHGAKSGVEIEANALWEVTEWLKRHPKVHEEQKQEYMQELLNKMVSIVRKGLVDPEDASRTIHECAHLLGLELANQLPVETILLTGMQKTTTALDVKETMRAFGPVEDAAVATGERGFGFVRFRTQKSIADAIYQFKTSEVVIKNVAITLRPLSAQEDDY